MKNEFKLKMPTMEEIQSRQFEEYVFEMVANEIQSGIKKTGLWAKAISEANGNENTARGLYIKYRAQSMIDEAYIAENEKRNDEELKRNSAAEQKELQRKVALATTELFTAAEYGRNKEVAQLLKHVVDVNVQRSDGATPLYLAALNGQQDTVIILIEHGAKTSISNFKGKIPSDAARVAGYSQIADYLDSLKG